MPTRELPTGRLTFLFTDIEGSTRLSAAVGEVFAGIVDRHHVIIRDAITADGGIDVSTEGDAFFAVFSSADAAVAATIRAQRDLAAEPWPGDATVRVRMGLHTGEGRLGGDSYAGYDVNLAARISDAANGGQIVLSAATAQDVAARLPDDVATRDLGDYRLKDIDGVTTIHQLVVAGLDDVFPALRAERPGSLPAPATSFVGRDEEVEAIARLLSDARIVTLTGPGGTGKTRLAIAAAARAVNVASAGTWFVPLEGVTDPDLVIPAVAAALDVREEPGRPLADTLARSLGDRPRLLVLDNLEQVIEAAGAIAGLVASAGGLRLIATSREPLRVAGEQELPVGTLPIAAAVELFVDRARLVQPSYAITDGGRDEVVELVERLDRLPLAVELAAARSRMFGPAALLARLDDRLSVLATAARDVPERQRTLRGAIEWSVDLLDDGERRALFASSVFRGGFDLPAAGAVLADGAVADLVVGSLVDKSLVAVADTSGTEPRFRMLDTIRSYASAERATDAAFDASVQRRHALHYLALAEELEGRFRAGDFGAAIDAAERDHDNLRVAMRWAIDSGEPAVAARLGYAQWRFWQHRGHMREGRDRLDAVLAMQDVEADPRTHAMALRALNGVRFWLEDTAGAREAAATALAILDDLDEPDLEAGARFDLAWSDLALGHVDAARAGFEAALAGFEAAGDRAGAMRSRSGLINALIREGEWDAAAAAYDPLVAEVRATGEAWQIAERLSLGFVIAVERGDATAARRYSHEASRHIMVGSGRYASWFEGAAFLAVLEGRPELAARWIGAIDRIRDDGGGAMLASELLGLDSAETRARAAIGDDFQRLAAEGRRLSADEAYGEVAAYLEDTGPGRATTT